MRSSVATSTFAADVQVPLIGRFALSELAHDTVVGVLRAGGGVLVTGTHADGLDELVGALAQRVGTGVLVANRHTDPYSLRLTAGAMPLLLGGGSSAGRRVGTSVPSLASAPTFRRSARC